MSGWSTLTKRTSHLGVERHCCEHRLGLYRLCERVRVFHGLGVTYPTHASAGRPAAEARIILFRGL